MTHQIQDISALFAVTSISDFTSWPRLATDVNLEAISAFPDAMEVRLDQMIQLYMDGLSHRFHYVDYLAYGDRTGTFVGIERLPTHFKDKHPSSSVFGGELLGLVTACFHCGLFFPVRICPVHPAPTVDGPSVYALAQLMRASKLQALKSCAP